MTGAFKDFDAAIAEQRQEPVSFRAGGEDFEIEAVNAGPLLKLARLASLEGAQAVVEFDNLCRALLSEKDQERWDKVLNRIPTETVVAIVEFIIEESTGKVTEQPSASRGRLPKSGRQSNTGSRPSAKKRA